MEKKKVMVLTKSDLVELLKAVKSANRKCIIIDMKTGEDKGQLHYRGINKDWTDTI
jgi:hypothetical protein